LLEKFGFYDTVISIKASTVKDMIDANRLIAAKCDYPLHLGVTEAGGGERGLLKSTAGIGALLCDGIGDTIRVSLTDDPVQEIAAARKILQALEIEGQSGLDIVSCPTCARTEIDLIPLVKRFEAAVAAEGLDTVPVKVALMGCVVNGPGEAREADVGIAGGKGEAVLFRHGEVVEKIPEAQIVERLLREVRTLKERKMI
jgi:(E)-4-hydroxy-3-methylbut-2-enyl-diphosphate synthase